MQYTEKLGLKLPESTDNYNIDDFNYNTLKLDNMDSAGLIRKYITPSVEQEELTPLVKYATIDKLKIRDTSSYVEGQRIPFLEFEQSLPDTRTVKLKLSNEAGVDMYFKSGAYASYCTCIAHRGGNYYTAEDFEILINNKSYTNTNYIDFESYNTSTKPNHKPYYLWDLGEPSTCKINYRYETSYSTPMTFYGSNNGTSWTTLAIASSGANTYSVSTPYRYIKAVIEGAGKVKNIYYMYLSDVQYNEKQFKNKFTIPNDLTDITDNERVLVETLKQGGSLNFNTAWEYNNDGMHATDSNGVEISSDNYDSTKPISNLFDGNSSTYCSLAQDDGLNHNFLIDLKEKCEIQSIVTSITYSTSYHNVVAEYSDDNENWNTLITFNGAEAGDTTHSFNNIEARYIRFKTTFISSGNQVWLGTLNVNYVVTSGMSTDGVISNTLNGIDIDTILRPSSHYELIYKEDLNKLITKNNSKIIFDTTISENVSQISTGISFKVGRTYIIEIDGGASNNVSADVKSNNSILSSVQMYSGLNNTIGCYIKPINIDKCFDINGTGTNGSALMAIRKINGLNDIIIDISSYYFLSGTRFIIYESEA